MKKTVAILATGGTISAKGEHRLDYRDYATGSFTIEVMIEHIRELSLLAHYKTEQVSNKSSCDFDAHDWLHMKERVEHYLEDENIAGVVITHGTSTLEETAYFLHLTVRSNKPIVFVGAQRPFDVIGTDATSNLLAAVRVALSPHSTGKGVLVVLNDQISSAREATKNDTYRLNTFSPRQSGYLGTVDPDDTIHFYRAPLRKHTTGSLFAEHTFAELPEVAIIYSYSGASGDVIRHIAACGKYRGIVVAGMGAGRVTTDEEQALQQAAEDGLTVVLSSRVGNGRVVPIKKYEHYPFITADDLLPQKARVLLMLALTKTKKMSDIQQFFHEY